MRPKPSWTGSSDAEGNDVADGARMRIFLDANILFSAAKSDGAVRRLLNLLAAAGHVCCADAYVIEEARRNLAVKGTGHLGDLEAVLRGVEVTSGHAAEPPSVRHLSLPEKDRPVLAAAIQLGCVALVTGDKTHFGRLYRSTIHGVTIHSPRSLAEDLLK